ncbi:MAG: BON domain-containing protein [Pseudomonadales bacterium]|nr:BON domain-containing protein [Pseudomonadales bacterium]
MNLPRFNAAPLLIAVLCVLLLGSCGTLTGPISEDYGKRTLGTVWDDQMVESRGISLIRNESPELKEAHINITSFNGTVLVSGQVPSEAAKTAAAAAIQNLRKVKKIHNELEVAGPTSTMARANDSYLTAKVKTALLLNGDTEALRIKVVTENNVVYLLGLVTRAESDAVVETARSVFGVQKIVKAFEYIN